MVAILFAALLAVIGLGLLIYSLRDADPARIARWLRRWGVFALLGLAGGGFLALALAGKMMAAVVALGALAPLLLRALAGWRRIRTAAGPSAGNVSEVETRFLKMRLDHDTGDVSGEVIAGPYAGRPLEDLSKAEALDLLALCTREDDQSVRLIQAWMARARPEWAQAGGEGRSASRGPMGVEEARDVLGVGPRATPEEIKAAHRRMMRQAHPDAGGSDWMAARVNEAKEVLLRG